MRSDLLKRATKLRAARWIAARPASWPWLLALLFVVSVSADLASLQANYDEGPYVLQARNVFQGQVPYADFFHHQPPLYLYLAAPFSALGSASLLAVRGLSMLATALAGIAVAAIARTAVAPVLALVAQVAFYAAPLQFVGLLAMPNALMILFSVLGLYLLVVKEGAIWSVLAGALLASAVLVKPIAVSSVLATALAIALHRAQRRKLYWFLAAGATTGMFGWLVFHAVSAGAFTEVLTLQATRVQGARGFEAMSHIPVFRATARAYGNTPLLWSANEHLRIFVTQNGFLNGNLWLLIAGVAGLFVGRHQLPRPLFALLVAWIAVPLAFSLVVWEPSWDHYFVQYLPSLAIGASLLMARAWREAAPERLLAAVALAAFVLVGAVYRPRDAGWTDEVRTFVAGLDSRKFLAFNPVLHVVADTVPACGLIDPLNVYGSHSAASLSPHDAFERFHVSSEDLVRCLEPETPVIVDQFAFWVMDMTLATRLLITERRVVYGSPGDKHRLREFIYFERKKQATNE